MGEVKLWPGKGWRAVGERGYPLAPLVQRVGPLLPRVLEGPANAFGARYFQLLLGRRGELCLALLGLYHQGGYPGYNWVEVIHLSPSLSFSGESRPLIATPLERALFRRLGEVVPPGGHLMVEYDSMERASTALGLAIGVPPLATPLGELLWAGGCGAGFKDWGIAEGGREGPRKLQGYKALNPEHARSKAAELVRELRAFLAQPSTSRHRRVEQEARRLLRRLSQPLPRDNRFLSEEPDCKHSELCFDKKQFIPALRQLLVSGRRPAN